ncbi:hypothetical protein CO656_19125 [Sinorhizobium sp. FG01]|uniref:Uncharacterized protein n=2 Tax=Sinorhizobium/Ensifer group TaxID=227292 RepID=A0A2S3YVQ1_9HYPH|nr:hypothetical protein CO656_19125 [Sinorhizobium sp. FG01]POH35704.1 hypothetical protein ATY31_00250 [Sinorhizobium americanum]
MTPSAAVAKLQAVGIHVSERTLRERARALGACRIIGKTMFMLPSDIDAILEAARPKPKVRYDVSPYEPKPAPIKRWTEYDTEQLRQRILDQNKQRNKAARKARAK